MIADGLQWVAVLTEMGLGLLVGALPAALGVLWGVMTLRRSLRASTIE